MRGRTVDLVVLLALSLLCVSLTAAEAQQATNMPRIGFLGSSSAERDKSRLAALQQGLRELGYVDGKDIVIEQRYAAGKLEDLPTLAAELVRLKIDVLVTEGTPAARAAKHATSAIPVVMGNSGDPVGTGLVASLARPGGNITGLSDFSRDLMTKRLELLKEVAPSASRVAVLLNPANPTNPLELQAVQTVAPTLGVTLLPFEAKDADEIDRAFTAMPKARIEALIVAGDPMLGTHHRQIAELAAQSQLPAMCGARVGMEMGCLMSYGTNFDDLYRRVATYVDKILKGAKPADLPVEQPVKFELIINLKTAKELGLTIPPTLLFQADEVIK